GAKYDSPGQRPGEGWRNCTEALKERNNRGKPRLSRPFRPYSRMMAGRSQGAALGCHILPCWGMGTVPFLPPSRSSWQSRRIPKTSTPDAFPACSDGLKLISKHAITRYGGRTIMHAAVSSIVLTMLLGQLGGANVAVGQADAAGDSWVGRMILHI